MYLPFCYISKSTLRNQVSFPNHFNKRQFFLAQGHPFELKKSEHAETAMLEIETSVNS